MNAEEPAEVVDVKQLVTQLRTLIEGARSRPMSGSAVVNRSQALELLGRVEAALGDGEDPSASAGSGAESRRAHQEEAARLLGEAQRERDRLVGESEVFRVAKVEADRIRGAAEREAAELRRDIDDYVDTRLATFEIALTKTLETVSRGRARLQDRSHFAALAEQDDQAGDGGESVLTTPPELRPERLERADGPDFEAPAPSG